MTQWPGALAASPTRYHLHQVEQRSHKVGRSSSRLACTPLPFPQHAQQWPSKSDFTHPNLPSLHPLAPCFVFLCFIWLRVLIFRGNCFELAGCTRRDQITCCLGPPTPSLPPTTSHHHLSLYPRHYISVKAPSSLSKHIPHDHTVGPEHACSVRALRWIMAEAVQRGRPRRKNQLLWRTSGSQFFCFFSFFWKIRGADWWRLSSCLCLFACLSACMFLSGLIPVFSVFSSKKKEQWTTKKEVKLYPYKSSRGCLIIWQRFILWNIMIRVMRMAANYQLVIWKFYPPFVLFPNHQSGEKQQQSITKSECCELPLEEEKLSQVSSTVIQKKKPTHRLHRNKRREATQG